MRVVVRTDRAARSTSIRAAFAEAREQFEASIPHQLKKGWQVGKWPDGRHGTHPSLCKLKDLGVDPKLSAREETT